MSLSAALAWGMGFVTACLVISGLAFMATHPDKSPIVRFMAATGAVIGAGLLLGLLLWAIMS